MGEEGKAFGFERFARVEVGKRLETTKETRKRRTSVIGVLNPISDLTICSARSHTKNLVGIACQIVIETTQEVNRAIAEFKSYPLVYTMDDVRKEGDTYHIRVSGSGMRGTLPEHALLIPFQ